MGVTTTHHTLYPLELYTELLSPSAGDGAVTLYLAGYVFLIITLASALGCLVSPVQSLAHSQTFLTIAVQARTRWFLVFVLLSLAGLPPFFFFGCKVALLGLLTCSGVFLTNLAVAVLVVLSWAVYFGAVRRLVYPVTGVSNAPLRYTRLAPRQAYALAAAAAGLCFGLFVFEDAALLLLGSTI